MMDAPSRDRRGLVEVRSASSADATSIADLHGRSFLATYADLPMTVEATARGGSERVALWANRIEGPPAGCAVLVAHNNDGLQGFVYVGPTGDTDDSSGRTGQVFSIHVDPQAWGAGVGSELLDEAVSFLRATGFDDATLWVVEGNHRARHFYEARGWQVDGARRHEVLVIGGGEGDQVEVVRYRRQVTVGENR